MAIGGVVFQFLADTGKAVRDIGNLTRSLGKVENEADATDQSLKDVDRALDHTGAAARDADRDLDVADRALDALADEAHHAADALQTAGRRMGDGIETGAREVDRQSDAMRRDLGEAGRESGAEFIGNIAEGIGSGQANLNDVISGTLGGVTNLAASLSGPIGLVAGAAAAGVGLLFSAVKGESDKAKERVKNLSDALADLGTTSSKAAKQVIWETWLTTMQEMPGALDNIVAGLKAAGIKGTTFKAALTGSVEAQKQIKQKLKETSDQIAANVRAGKPLTADQQLYLEHQADIIEELQNQGIALDDVEELQSNINFLLGKGTDKAGAMGGELDDAADDAHRLSGNLDDAAKDRHINWNIDFNGGMTMGEFLEGLHSQSVTLSRSAMAATRATRGAYDATYPAPAPYMRTITDEQVYRAVSRLLVRGTARNGRHPRIA